MQRNNVCLFPIVRINVPVSKVPSLFDFPLCMYNQKAFFYGGTNECMKRWAKCVEMQEGYVDK